MLTLVVEMPMLKMKIIMMFSSFQFCISDFFYVSLQLHVAMFTKQNYSLIKSYWQNDKIGN